MEDDGTVNMMKQPSSSVLAPPVTPTSTSSGSSSSSSSSDRDYGARVDLDYNQDVASGGVNYGSLKDLLPVKKLTWTKLDFKGASVEDERRMKKKVVAAGDAASAGGGDVIGDTIGSNDRRGRGLKELLPVKPTWTKLDFRGASVEDERRTRRKDSPQSSTKSFNEGQYSNLTTLLPERTITFRQGQQVYSSGSATMVNSNVMRTPRLGSQQQTGGNDVSQQQQQEEHGDEVDDGVSDNENTDKAYDSMQEKTTYTNLKDLLPERKMSWRTTK